MKLMTLSELSSHCAYEFAYAHNYPDKHWCSDSLYLYLEDFCLLSPYLNQVFSTYHYYGPQKVLFSEWEQLKILLLSDKKLDLKNFTQTIDKWLDLDNSDSSYFWILGI